MNETPNYKCPFNFDKPCGGKVVDCFWRPNCPVKPIDILNHKEPCSDPLPVQQPPDTPYPMIKCKNCGMVIGDNGYGYCEPCWWNMTPDAATKVIDPLNLLNGQRPIAPEPQNDKTPAEQLALLNGMRKDEWNAAVDECVKAIGECDRFTGHPGDMIYLSDAIAALTAVKK